MSGPQNKPTDEIDTQKINEFYEWCENNNLNSHITYTDPV